MTNLISDVSNEGQSFNYSGGVDQQPLIAVLPPEVMNYIFQFLKSDSLVLAGQVCTYWQALVSQTRDISRSWETINDLDFSLITKDKILINFPYATSVQKANTVGKLTILEDDKFKQLLPILDPQYLFLVPSNHIKDIDYSKLTQKQIGRMFPVDPANLAMSQRNFASLLSWQVLEIFDKLSNRQVELLVTPHQKENTLLGEKCDRRFHPPVIQPQIRTFSRLEVAEFYRELGIANGASIEEIKRAYRKLALQLHPSKSRNEADSADRFIAVDHAYKSLLQYHRM